MSDDLCERLRADADEERDRALEQDFWHEEILREAAETIERLRAELDAVVDWQAVAECYEKAIELRKHSTSCNETGQAIFWENEAEKYKTRIDTKGTSNGTL